MLKEDVGSGCQTGEDQDERPRKRWKETVKEAFSTRDLPNIERLREEEIVFHARARWENMLVPLTGREMKPSLGAKVRSG